MAMVQSEYVLSYTIRDEAGSVSVLSVSVDRAIDRKAVAGYAASLYTKLNALTDGAIDKYTISEVYNDAVAVPAAGCDVEQKGVFSFGFTSGNKGVLSVPAIKNGVLATNLKDINLAQSDVATFIAALKDGTSHNDSQTPPNSVTVKMVNNYAFPIARVVSAYKQNRLSHKERGIRKG